MVKDKRLILPTKQIKRLYNPTFFPAYSSHA